MWREEGEGEGKNVCKEDKTTEEKNLNVGVTVELHWKTEPLFLDSRIT